MQLSSIILVASGLAFVGAAPQPIPQDEPLPPSYTLYVTFWEKGCQDPSDTNGNIASFTVNDIDETADRPEDCVQLTAYGWQSVDIVQPTDSAQRYSVDLFSGLGCNNPLIVIAVLACYHMRLLIGDA
jgi:hypothetical protein